MKQLVSIIILMTDGKFMFNNYDFYKQNMECLYYVKTNYRKVIMIYNIIMSQMLMLNIIFSNGSSFESLSKTTCVIILCILISEVYTWLLVYKSTMSVLYRIICSSSETLIKAMVLLILNFELELFYLPHHRRCPWRRDMM